MRFNLQNSDSIMPEMVTVNFYLHCRSMCSFREESTTFSTHVSRAHWDHIGHTWILLSFSWISVVFSEICSLQALDWDSSKAKSLFWSPRDFLLAWLIIKLQYLIKIYKYMFTVSSLMYLCSINIILFNWSENAHTFARRFWSSASCFWLAEACSLRESICLSPCDTFRRRFSFSRSSSAATSCNSSTWHLHVHYSLFTQN